MATTLRSSHPMHVLPLGRCTSAVNRAGCPHLKQGLRAQQLASVRARAEDESKPAYNKEFGYSRKDVIIICVGLIALGYALYYGLQAFGVEQGMAGSFTQLIMFTGLCVGWVGSYVFRVATKQMTYVKQLDEYEEAVMKKRLEELTEDELDRMMKERK